MAHATLRVTSAPTGDAALKQLEKRKSDLTTDVAALGIQIDEAEKKIEIYNGLDEACAELEEELSVLTEERDDLLSLIADLSERADAQRRLSDEIPEKKKQLDALITQITDAHVVLSKIAEQIRLKEKDVAALEAKYAERLTALGQEVQKLETDLASMNGELRSLQLSITHYNTVDATKRTDYAALEEQSASLHAFIESQKKEVTDFENLIATKKNELTALAGRIEEKEEAFVSSLVERTRVLDTREIELARREGALSDRASMLDSRASSLNAIKVRLEHHMGKRIDLVIE